MLKSSKFILSMMAMIEINTPFLCAKTGIVRPNLFSDVF